MQVYLTLTRRELAGFFVSITGYVIIAAVMFLMGFSFIDLLKLLQGESTPAPVTRLFFSTQYFWLILLLSTPVITMRLFAQEKYSGTFETLMTAPVSDFEVVLAKFSAAMIFYVIMWLPSLASILILRRFISNPEAVDVGMLVSTYLGIGLIGGLFMSLGCLASALTRNQIVAAMISLTFGFSLFLLSYLPGHLTMSSGWFAQVVSYLGLFDHLNDFARGVVDSRRVIFYLGATCLFLFFTLRVVESRRWK